MKRFINSVLIILLASVNIIAEEKCIDFSNLFELSRQYVTSQQGLILRTEPSQKSAKIVIIPFNEIVDCEKMTLRNETIGGIYGSWSYITWKDYKGWVFNGFLSINQPLPFKPKNESEIRKLLTAVEFYKSCDISFRLNNDMRGTGSFDYCAGGEAPFVKKIEWEGSNPYEVSIILEYPAYDGSPGDVCEKSPVARYEAGRNYTIIYDDKINEFKVVDETFKYKSITKK